MTAAPKLPSSKNGYKQTEVGVIPEDWEVKSLGECASFRTGPFGSALHKSDYTEDGIPVVNPMHINDGRIEPTRTMTITEKAAKALSDFRLKTGEIVIGRRGDMGRCAVVMPEQAGWLCGTGSMIIRGGATDVNFLQRVLSSPRAISAIEDTSVGSTMINLNQGTLGGLKLQVPSLPEQRAIATALSDVDGLLGGLDRLIAKKRDLKQAAMQQLLTGQTRLPGFHGEWKETTLGDIGECIIGLTYKPENVVKHGLLVLRSSNVQNGRITYDDNVYVNLEVADHLYTQVGDLLICVRNGSRALIGKCAVIDRVSAGLTFGAFMAMYRTKHWRFVVHAFQGDDIQCQIRDNIGATINQITNKDMKAFRIKLPPEAEQIAIAEVLSDMDAELAALEQRREKTRALKQAMMQELLTGRTRLV